MDSLALKTVDSLLQVCRESLGTNDYAGALEVIASAEKIALMKIGRETACFANCCHLHGSIYSYKADFKEAESWFIEAIAIREKVLGKDHLELAKSLNNLGLVYDKIGEYEKSEPFYLEALRIREKGLGKEHSDYAISLNNVGVLYWDMGNYEKAEPFYLGAKNIWAKTPGTKHLKYAMVLNNLGNLYEDLGKYELAEACLQEALEIRGEVLGKDDPDYAGTVNNLAILYMHMGNSEKTELLYKEALAIREKVLGKEHPNYAASLNNLALAYMNMGAYKKAEPLFMEAQNINAQLWGKEHPDYALGLHNLAALYYRTGDMERSHTLFLEALRIREMTLGRDHPQYVTSLNGLAVLYRKWGYYRKSDSLYLQVKQIREKILGKQHPDYAKVLDDLVESYLYSGNYEAAKALIVELSGLNRDLIAKGSKHLSESEMDYYLLDFVKQQDKVFFLANAVRQGKLIDDTMESACFDNILFFKGFLLYSSNRVKNLSATDHASAEKYNLLKAYQRRLAAEYVKPISERKWVSDLEEKVNILEKELTRMVAGLGEALKQVTWQELQQKLKSGEAAIEFVRYKCINPEPTDSIMYAALLLLPEAKHPVFIPLCAEKQLDALLQTHGKPKPAYINTLYTSTADKSLHALLWQPMEPLLGGTKTIYFSPTGLFHRLNLGAVPVPQEQGVKETIADRFRLVELGSTRQLVLPMELKSGASAPMLYGGIQYDLDSADVALSTIDMKAHTLTNRWSQVDPDSTLRGGKWQYLLWTDVEINAAEALLSDAGLNPVVLKGRYATEESFKSIGKGKPSPRVLHLATHGFFFPDSNVSSFGRTTTDASEPVFKTSDHPMIRSGLIMAGGNHAWQFGKPVRPDREDGILTAYEISQMDLGNTELVVLSACETGLGNIQGNEGVYGLQRAFKIAGVKYLIMSLWQVPDFQTQELMAHFYSNWIEGEMTIPDAFNAAQKTMRKQYKDPFLWAGFVLVE